ncbi:hypothetical protein BU16DRAFT_530028 [Lophium mytilinum]|uniref:Gfd2/YDR514C-like C-terminal domain-containing protein n=1 Tax=Lophium mytilinum TaxID=390894 RepID=A0A6A6QHI2_9PEZI|nr:hypothetical protein BU16DRAFT_530028 [Lophium mytilinum]
MATAIRTPAAPGTTPVVPKLVPAVPRILSKQGCFAPAAPGKVRDLNDNSTSSTPDTQSVPSTNDSESSASSSLPAPGVSLLNRKCKFPQLHDQMVGLTDKEAMQHALEIKSTENGSTDIVICAIDLEWHDVEPRELTEIGLAILDTRDFHGLKDGPGANGENLMKQVQFYHYRIKEHGHMENKYCIGHPERFEWGIHPSH